MFVKYFLHAFDALQVISSVSDVILDVSVCFDLYSKERFFAFYASLLVFFLANASYSFLFVATFGRNIHSVKGKSLVFFFSLPFSQLVPVFTWLESFHFSHVDSLLSTLNLSPSPPTFVEEEEDNKIKTASEDDDFALGSFVQKKFSANVGFLLEAIVEAIPQSIIQVAVLIYYEEETLNILLYASILMSVFCIASKGYMVSYSIHLPTLLFHSFCVFGDVCGLFASLFWVLPFASNGSDTTYWWWWGEFLVQMEISGVFCFGLSLCLFSSADDVLKHLYFPKNRWKAQIQLATGNTFFDLVICRLMMLVLACLPMSVLLLTMKLTWFPLLYFDSLEPSHYSFPLVSRRMYSFLLKADTPRRVFELNTLLEHALVSSDMLSKKIKAAALHRTKANMESLRNCVHLLAPPPTTRGRQRRQQQPPCVHQNPHVADLVLLSNEIDSTLPVQFVDHSSTGEHEKLSELQRRSVIYGFLMGVSKTNRRSEWNLDTNWERALKVMGLLCFMSTVGCALVSLPFVGGQVLLGLYIPLFAGPFYANDCLEKNSALARLALVFTCGQVVSIASVIGLTPAVLRFQHTAQSVIRIRNHDSTLGGDAFYKVGLDVFLEEAYMRYRKRLGQEKLREFLSNKTNSDCMNIIWSFLLQGEEGV